MLRSLLSAAAGAILALFVLLSRPIEQYTEVSISASADGARIRDLHGAGAPWQSQQERLASLATASPSYVVPPQRPAPPKSSALSPMPGLALLGSRRWNPLRPPRDLSDWIGPMQQQLRLPSSMLTATKPQLAVSAAAVGNASGGGCKHDCSNRGRCDQLLGKCICRHGFSGEACDVLTKQICNDPREKCVGRDCHEWTRLVSRCSGTCDYTSNRCTCGPRSAYPNRHMFMCEMEGISRYTPWRSPGWAHFTIASPHEMWGAPNATPPWLEEAAGGRKNLERLWAQSYKKKPEHLKAHRKGEKLAWCDIPLAPEKLRHTINRRRAQLRYPRCGCYEDQGGSTCDLPVRSFCLNQCSFRGDCIRGYCVCQPGWTGADCSTPLAALDPRTTKLHVRHDASADPAAAAAASPSSSSSSTNSRDGVEETSRPSPMPSAVLGKAPALRPSIYVYELPVKFNLWLAETRLHPQDCTYRRYLQGVNETYWENYAFGLELALHEILLASPHRTFDPESADYFFVPVYGGCYISRFFRPTPLHNIIMVGYGEWKAAPVRGNEFYRQALHWIRTAYPFWNRSYGADHLFAFPHDEGACVAPIELANATLLTSWGRLEKQPKNATTTMVEHSWYVPEHINQMYASKHCYDPAKDILMPVFTSIKQIFKTPHLSKAPRERKLLFSWRGQVLYHFPKYSFGIRQQLIALFKDRETEGIVVSDKHSPNYLKEMLDSKFCGVFPGNGWGHIEAPILLGCIPVVIQDEILTPWENVLNFSSFAVRIQRKHFHQLPEILRAIPPDRISAMQDALSRVWERFTYSSLALAERDRRCAEAATDAHSERQCKEMSRQLKGSAAEATGRDAVDTLMHVLQARLLARQGARRRA